MGSEVEGFEKIISVQKHSIRIQWYVEILELVKVDNFVFISENIGVVHHNRYYVDSLSESLKSGVTK